MRVGVQSDVRDRVTFRDKESPPLELRLHDVKRESSLLQAHGQLRAAGRVERQVPDDEARRCDERLMAGLLEKHPLKHLRTQQRFGRQEGAALSEIPEDGVGLGEARTVLELECRGAAVGVLAQKLRSATRTSRDVELAIRVRPGELR